MPISLNDLYKVLNKEASQNKQPDPGLQAMLLAAQAAKPAGAPALPKAIEQPQPDEQESAGPDLEKLIQDKDKELEKKKKEAEDLRHQLQQELLQHLQAVLLLEVEKKEKESILRIKLLQEELLKLKTIQEAELILHKALLDKETAMAQVKLEQLKSKTLIDLSKQLALLEIQHIDRTRKNVDKYMLESVKKLDKQKLDFEASKSAVSPALQSVMDSALSSLHKIPTPGGMPITIKKANQFTDGLVEAAKHVAKNNPITATYNAGLELLQKGKLLYSDAKHNVVVSKIAEVTGPYIAQIIAKDEATVLRIADAYSKDPNIASNPQAVMALFSDSVKLELVSNIFSGNLHRQNDAQTNKFLESAGLDIKSLLQQGINVTGDGKTPDKVTTTDRSLNTLGDFFVPQYSAQELNSRVSELVKRKIKGTEVNLSDYTDPITKGIKDSTGLTHINPYLSDSDLQFIVDNWSKLSYENKKAAGAILSPKFRAAVPGGFRFEDSGDPTFQARLDSSGLVLKEYHAFKNAPITSVSASQGGIKKAPSSVYSISPFDLATGGLYSAVAPYIPMVGNALGVPITAPGFSTPSRLKPSKFKPIDALGIAHEGNITYKDSRLQHIGNNSQLSNTIPGGSMLRGYFNS